MAQGAAEPRSFCSKPRPSWPARRRAIQCPASLLFTLQPPPHTLLAHPPPPPHPLVNSPPHSLAAMNLNGGQDWDQVVIRKKAPTSAAAQKPSAVNAAIRAGERPLPPPCAGLLHPWTLRVGSSACGDGCCRRFVAGRRWLPPPACLPPAQPRLPGSAALAAPCRRPGGHCEEADPGQCQRGSGAHPERR
jgi:hypothetical protein